MAKRSILLVATVAVLMTLIGATAQKAATAAAPLPFSAARRAGPTLYVSGQVARTPSGQSIHDSIEAETRQVMENIGKVLKDNGYGFNDVVNATVYLAVMDDYAAMNQVYASYFTNGFPARACVGGVKLVSGFKVEISCVAYKTGE